MKELLEKWIGTPYFHAGKNRYGVDCTGFIQQFYIEAGILKEMNYRKYSPNWFIHADEEYILDGIEKAIFVEGYVLKESDINKIKTGDLICFRNSRSNVVHHVGIFYERGKFVHATEHLGVHTAQLYPFWINKVEKVFTVERI